MNLLLIEPEELGPGGRVRLTGRRAGHLLRVIQVSQGQVLRAGVLGRGLGTARVVGVEPGPETAVEVAIEGVGEVPDRVAGGPPVELILALPRPKALRRILRLVSAMGVRRVHLINAWRVEKSYFQSPLLEPEAIRKELLLGAEQGGTARLPEVSVERFFVPFVSGLEGPGPEGVEDRRPRLLAHPGAPVIEAVAGEAGAPGASLDEGCVLAVGPEGGWVEAELASFDRAGFRRVSSGPWVLTTEAAVAVALGQVALLARFGGPEGSAPASRSNSSSSS